MSQTTDRPGGPRNLAARLGRWSAAHWKTATFGWLAFVAVAFALGGMVGTKSIDADASAPGESGRMDRILDAGFRQPAGESVLVQSDSLQTDDPAFRAAIEDVVARVSKVAAVENVRSPLEPGEGRIAADGHAALVEFEIRGDRDDAGEKIGPVLESVEAAQRAHPDLFIGEFGEASATDAIETAYGDDLSKAGLLSLPITLIVLVIAFGALVAAGLPLLLGLTAVFGTFGLLALLSHVLPEAQQAPALVLLIGLAVGVDYSLFYLKRERQERAAGRDEQVALEAAAATSGRSVLVSGLTVMAAMAGMFLTGDGTFASLALAAILVVAVAVLGSLTVLPALLSRLGDRVDRLRIPLLGRRRRDGGEARIWGAIVDRVLRRPVLSAVLAGGLLLALAAPALQLRMATPGPDTLPQALPAVQAYQRMQQAFPGTALPASVVVKAADVNAPSVRDAIDRLEQGALASDLMYEPITVEVNEDATVANVTVPIAGTGTDADSTAALTTLRREIVPETVGALPGVEAGVTGPTASWMDGEERTTSKLPLVVAFVLVLAFALMLVAFRSLVIAAKAIVLNLLSVAAAYGVLVLVFQHGVGKGLLGFSSTAGIDPVVPLLLFVILFGLSMDYHVFILSRIRERFDRGDSVDAAVAHGIRSTAGVVTSAAIVMVCVFAVFATLSMLFFKQFGVGLAAAVLIDATIVRAVLLPATMKLLGKWNWYLPRWLEWLPRLEQLDPDPVPAPAAAPAPETVPAPARPGRKRGRAFTPGRIVSLLLVGLVAFGLASVHAASGPDASTVPDGAQAGDLTLEPCEYETEDGDYAADCGTLVVPENRTDPQSRLIALPVTRIHARSATPAEPIFRLQGGPGVTNMEFEEASRLAGDHDVVLVGYRGVDGSERLDCPEVESALGRSEDVLGERSFDAYAAAFRTCAERLAGEGVDVTRYGLVQQVDDLEAARVALGYDRIDLVSESAGTRTAMIYAWRYPESIHRSVMIAVNPPGNFLWSPETTDEQLGRYAELCAADAGCRDRTGDLAASLRRAAADMPDRWLFLPIREGNARVVSFLGLMEAGSEAAPASGPMTLDGWLSAQEGDASGLWFASLAADILLPKMVVWGQYAAAGSIDAGAARDYFASEEPGAAWNLGRDASSFIWGGGRLADAWPAAAGVAEYRGVRPSDVETLLVGGELDLSTPPQTATRELLPYLRNGHQVVLAGFGHTIDFWTEQPDAGARLIDTFLDSGRVDDSLYVPHGVDLTPGFTDGMIAKIVAGSLAGLVLLTLLSLAWMSRRVHRARRFGSIASAVLRSGYAVVLGAGGWSLGALLVVTTMPGVPLDGELLTSLSVGVPVGLGLYLAWVDRDWAAETKTVGFAAAAMGALLGAWLGFQAGEGFLAILTTVAGAVAGGNLALLVLDIGWDRQARDRFLEPAATERLETRPTTG